MVTVVAFPASAARVPAYFLVRAGVITRLSVAHNIKGYPVSLIQPVGPTAQLSLLMRGVDRPYATMINLSVKSPGKQEQFSRVRSAHSYPCGRGRLRYGRDGSALIQSEFEHVLKLRLAFSISGAEPLA